MNILVLNGSPKGKNSVTFQSIRYLQKHHPDIDFQIFHVGQKIKAIERKAALFDSIIQAARDSDCVIWCYPVYTLLIPYQLLRFIDLIFERGQTAAFAGKYATQLSTSKHFHDHIPINYLQHISEDLGMKHLPAHTADMDDLTIAKGRARLRTFGTELVNALQNHIPVSQKYAPVTYQPRPYTPPPNMPTTPKTHNYNIVLVTDCTDPHSNLQRMIDTYRQALPNPLTIFNISDFKFSGGCLGCFQCAFEGHCVHKDGFDDYHRNTVLNVDCIIMAGNIRRHWLNSVWKKYNDRQFYNGHRTSMMGKSIGHILSGPLRQEGNLRQALEARCEVGQMYLLDIISDEYDSDSEITALLTQMAQQTMWAVEHQPQRPNSFLGVGGMKIFRDVIYVMQGLMQEDHRFYKQHGQYDFPHKQWPMFLKMQLVGLLLKFKYVRRKMSGKMNDVILKAYNEAIERY